MVKRSAITFAELRQLLLDLGFTQTKRDKFWFFEHPPSDTVLTFRPYRANEKVTLIDRDRTRQHLDWRGVLEEQRFDDLLRRATA